MILNKQNLTFERREEKKGHWRSSYGGGDEAEKQNNHRCNMVMSWLGAGIGVGCVMK